MTFAQPIWLVLTPLIVLLAAGLFAYGLRKRSELLADFAAARLIDRLTERASLPRILTKAALVVLALAAVALALARPQWGVEWTERKARGLDLVFVLDASRSMLATDQRPNRLERAKLAVLDLIDRLESDRIGLVVFAGQAFLQTPPTLDYVAFRESLDAVDPAILTRGGSDLGGAIREAAKAFPSEGNVKVVVLLTDGEDLGGDAREAAEAAAGEGIRIHTIGLGTAEGEYLRVRNSEGREEFVRDADGQPVRSKLDEATLRRISESTGGLYSRLNPGSLARLYDEVLAALPREERESQLREIRVERFQWPLAAAFALLVVESLIRRRARAAAALILLCGLALPAPRSLHAQDSPSSPPPAAEELYNRAVEAIQGGNYEGAIDELERALRQSDRFELQRDALYNMAHAKHQLGEEAFRAGEFERAIESWKKAEDLFRSARQIDREDAEAEADRAAVENRRKALEGFLKQQEQQQEQQQDQQQQQQEQEQQDPQSGDDSGDSPPQESSGGESGQSEGEEASPEAPQQQSGDTPETGSEPTGDAGDEAREEPGDPPDGAEGEDESPESPQDDAAESQPDEGGAPESGEPQEARPEQASPQAETGGPEADPDSPPEEAAPEDASAPDAGERQEVPAVPETPEASEEGEADGRAAASAEAIEGMSERQARELLESLRGSEKLLPFVEQSPRDRGQDLKDW